MNFKVFKEIINGLPDSVKEVTILDNGDGNDYEFNILTKDGYIEQDETDLDYYFDLRFE